MEVADQWRRQWAGTAEYGKVTEGGVTRRVARAMEVLHASGPGARVRVMRAAYHSSAGPGAPAESFMLHSSRRVISSGYNFLESPLLPTKPLEISSTPLEIIHDSNGETENYKVTEPDDFEISEPSKWKGSTRGSSLRMPSEESSSTDNASIIDFDSRNGKNLHRKYSYDSESSDIQFRSRSNSRNSQLLDAPTTLSTLKYKSLLNSTNEWNTRRKSYSFEDTSPLNETILHNNATLAMESSTDSGICKSTEIVNDHIDDNSHIRHFGNDERIPNNKEESFKEWLTKNRQNSQYKGAKSKIYRNHDIVIEDPKENNIAVQSSGKLSITLPVTIEGGHDNQPKKIQQSEDIDRRVKKVEFCKTEVHFTAESGKVNIIATDEKPPPTNDFRKRRSAFVPMKDMVDRPITLFGDKNDLPIANGVLYGSDYSESDENTAATKSILKNKIPKPKPYLLGENMDFGTSSEVTNKNTRKSTLSAVSLVNQQMEPEKHFKGEIKSIFSKEAERNVINNNCFRTINAGLTKNDSLNREKYVVKNIKIEKARDDDNTENIKTKLSSLKGSPIQAKPKARQLRDSDFTYFGIDNDRKMQESSIKPMESKFSCDNVLENIFHSVKMIQKVSNSVSNSVCNSEPESEDEPEYQNIPLNINCAPVPTPRMRSKFDAKPNEIAVVRASLKPIIEKEHDEMVENVKPSTRRTKARRHEKVKASRSLSEPPKNFKRNSPERSSRRGHNSSCSKNKIIKEKAMDLSIANNQISEEEKDIPIYANLMKTIKSTSSPMEKHTKLSTSLRTKETNTKSLIKNKTDQQLDIILRSDSGTDSSLRNKHSVNKDTISSSLRREAKTTPGEKKIKSHYKDTRRKITDELSDTKNIKNRDNKYKSEENNKSDRYSRSLLKATSITTSEEFGNSNLDRNIMHRDTSSHRKRNTSEDKKTLRENIKPSFTLDSDSTERYSSQTKNNERGKDIGSKHHHRSNKQREYVINYDDKNGTVSSICQIKTGLGTPRRKKSSKEISKENHKDNALKTKPEDQIALRNAVRRSSERSKRTEIRRQEMED